MRSVCSVIFCASFVIGLVSCASIERVRPETVPGEIVGVNNLGHVKFDEKKHTDDLGFIGPITDDDLECDDDSDEEADSRNYVEPDQKITADVVSQSKPIQQNPDDLECDDDEDEDVSSLPSALIPEQNIPVDVVSPPELNVVSPDDLECDDDEDEDVSSLPSAVIPDQNIPVDAISPPVLNEQNPADDEDVNSLPSVKLLQPTTTMEIIRPDPSEDLECDEEEDDTEPSTKAISADLTQLPEVPITPEVIEVALVKPTVDEPEIEPVEPKVEEILPEIPELVIGEPEIPESVAVELKDTTSEIETVELNIHESEPVKSELDETESEVPDIIVETITPDPSADIECDDEEGDSEPTTKANSADLTQLPEENQPVEFKVDEPEIVLVEPEVEEILPEVPEIVVIGEPEIPESVAVELKDTTSEIKTVELNIHESEPVESELDETESEVPDIIVETITPDPSADIECDDEEGDSEPTTKANSADLTQLPEENQPVEFKVDEPEILLVEPKVEEILPEVPEIVVIGEPEIPEPVAVEVKDTTSKIETVELNIHGSESVESELDETESEVPDIIVETITPDPSADIECNDEEGDSEPTSKAISANLTQLPEESQPVEFKVDEPEIELVEPKVEEILPEVPDIIVIDEPEIADPVEVVIKASVSESLDNIQPEVKEDLEPEVDENYKNDGEDLVESADLVSEIPEIIIIDQPENKGTQLDNPDIVLDSQKEVQVPKSAEEVIIEDPQTSEINVIPEIPVTETSKPCNIEKIINRLREDFGGQMPYALQYLLRSYESSSRQSEAPGKTEVMKEYKYPVTLFPVQWIPVPIMPNASWGTYPNPWITGPLAKPKTPCDVSAAKVEEPTEMPSSQWLPSAYGRQ